MAAIGADTEALRDLEATLARSAAALRASAGLLDRSLGATRWIGPDAERFRASWRTHRTAIGTAAADLESLAHDLGRQRSEQERASSADVAATAMPSPPPVHRPGAIPPPAVMEAREPPPGPPPWGDPLPLRSESWSGSAAASAALGLSGAASITVAELRGGATAVTIESGSELGVSGGVSAGAEVEGVLGVELGADGAVGAGITERRTWLADDGDTRRLVASLGLAELSDAATGLPGPLGALMPFAPQELAADLAARLLWGDPPQPAVTDLLVGVSVSAGATASLGVPVADLGGELSQRIGVRSRAGQPSLLFETGGAWTAGATGRGGASEGSWSIEVPLVDGPDQPVIVTESVSGDGGQTLKRHVASFDRASARPVVEAAVERLRAGDHAGAAVELGRLWTTVDPELTWRDATWGEVDTDGLGVDVGAALGPRLSGSISGDRRSVEYGRP